MAEAGLLIEQSSQHVEVKLHAFVDAVFGVLCLCRLGAVVMPILMGEPMTVFLRGSFISVMSSPSFPFGWSPLLTTPQWRIAPAYRFSPFVRTEFINLSQSLLSSANNRCSTSCSWISGMDRLVLSLDCPEWVVLEPLQ